MFTKILLTLIYFRYVHSEDNNTLKLVSVLYRHGDRSPVKGFPNDEHQESEWKLGYGQLTHKGMQQAYTLGQFLRQRYMETTPLLNTTFNSKEIYVQSSDKDRALSSAQLVLNGLYPPAEEDRWREGLDWQPVPVHTVPTTQDNMLNIFAYCGKLTEENTRILNETTPYMMEKYGTFMESVSNKSGYGWDPHSENYLINVTYLWDTLFCELGHGLSLPSWADNVTLSTLEEIYTTWNYLMYKSDLQKKLLGGPLVGKMLTDMWLKTNKSGLQNMKMFMYSAHDHTLIGLLSALGIFENQTIPYSSCMMVELHEKNDLYFVKMFIKTDPEQEPIQLKLTDCDYECDFETFYNLTKDVVPADWTRECLSMPDSIFDHVTNIMWISIGVGAALFLLIVIITACCCRGKPRVVKTYGRIRVNRSPEEVQLMSTRGQMSDEE